MKTTFAESIELFVDAWRAIIAHKLRSFLTLAGIVFGVASLVAMFSIVSGIKTLVMDDFDELGLKTTFEFEFENVESEKAIDHLSKGLVWPERDSLVALRTVVSGSAGISSTMIGQAALDVRNFPVNGVEPDYLPMRHLTTVKGRGLTDLDVARRAPIAVLGTRAASELFGDIDPIGRYFLLNGKRFEAVGLVEAPKFQIIGANFEFLERRIYIPVSTYLARFAGNKNVHFVVVSAPSYSGVGPAIRDAEAKILRLHRGVRDFEINNLAAEYGENVALADSILTGWNIVLGAIAVISLVIGGIGLFSILQVSVRERVREIGVRKAVGADDADIQREFMAESLTLAAFGGLVGILAGAALLLTAETIAGLFGRDWALDVSPLGASIGFVFSIAVGLGFGIYPARRAADLDPVTAISQ